MSNYTRLYDFSAKDLLATGNPSKLIKGSEVDGEFDAIVTAVATKQDAVSGATANNVATLTSAGLVQDGGTALSALAPLASPTFTGTPTLPTGTIGVTQTAGDNSTKLATTAYADTAASNAVNASSELTIFSTLAASNSGSAAHGLGEEPDAVFITLECLVADNSYSIGDRIAANASWSGDGSDGGRSWGVYKDATNVYVDKSATIFVQTKGGTSFAALTNASWKMVCKAVAFG